ncbi:insulinase family protein [candidate division KSB1 bacterium]|nr:insulinase family protein [candidate division KSB1 bacterium]
MFFLTQKNILKMKTKDFIKYKKQHYLPEATVIVVVGQGEKKVLKEVKRIFGNIKRGHKIGKIKVKEIQTKPKVLIKFKKTS